MPGTPRRVNAAKDGVDGQPAGSNLAYNGFTMALARTTRYEAACYEDFVEEAL